MNCRSHIFEVHVEQQQICDIAACIFHTLLFHRSMGKFYCQPGNNTGGYSVATLGFRDVDCNFFDFTYVRCDSDALDKFIMEKINDFVNSLSNSKSHSKHGQITLEFYQKRTRWLFPLECISWEYWTLKIMTTVFKLHEDKVPENSLPQFLTEKVFYIAEAINRPQYVPKIPLLAELDLVFDTQFPDVQPYLFKISHHLNSGNPSYISSMKRLISGGLTGEL